MTRDEAAPVSTRNSHERQHPHSAEIAEATLGTAVLVIGGPGTAIFATGGFNEGQLH
jgi:hypothetical protein